jgi:predicted transposase YdaD
MLPAVSQYIVLVSETPVDRLRKIVARLGPEVEEDFMTTADMLRAEGEAKGRAEGRAEGRTEGRTEGAATLLVRQLTRRFGPIPDTVRERIGTATLEQLAAWSDRVLDAPNLDDVFD